MRAKTRAKKPEDFSVAVGRALRRAAKDAGRRRVCTVKPLYVGIRARSSGDSMSATSSSTATSRSTKTTA